jgi:SAM-dependent methyltransferase
LRYDDVLQPLREAYDKDAEPRDGFTKQPWKLAERETFGKRLDGGRLLEIGAGTGHDSVYFRDRGLDVVAVDLSPAMVERCIAKGLDARVGDFLHLDFAPATFDAVYALNCLLHVPNADLPAVLTAIDAVLRPGGLFFMGLYGAVERDHEGPLPDDDHEPRRFFSLRTDEHILGYVRSTFDVLDFHTLSPGGLHFQSLTLAGPRSGPP